jgi:leucyl/phenylalanyl-tRNA--protein transferase
VPVYRLGSELVFPSPEEAEPGGLLAVGGDLSPERLLLAYSQGIFPWYDATLPILWHSPDPRMVLVPHELHVPRSLAKTLRRARFDVTLDACFPRVIEACAETPRGRGDGTWITDEMREAYVRLHALGFAHSVEAWCGGELAGGAYGVALGACFFGESMFAHRSDASKVAFATLVRQLERWGFELIDCQMHTEHLARFGGRDWPRARFLRHLRRALGRETRRGPWTLDGDLGRRNARGEATSEPTDPEGERR